MPLNHLTKPQMEKGQGLETSINVDKGNIDEEKCVKLGEYGSVDLDLITGKQDKELGTIIKCRCKSTFQRLDVVAQEEFGFFFHEACVISFRETFFSLHVYPLQIFLSLFLNNL